MCIIRTYIDWWTWKPFGLYVSSVLPALDSDLSFSCVLKESYHAIDLRCANHTPVLSIGEGVVKEIAESHKYLVCNIWYLDLFGNCWSRRYGNQVLGGSNEHQFLFWGVFFRRLTCDIWFDLDQSQNWLLWNLTLGPTYLPLSWH